MAAVSGQTMVADTVEEMAPPHGAEEPLDPAAHRRDQEVHPLVPAGWRLPPCRRCMIRSMLLASAMVSRHLVDPPASFTGTAAWSLRKGVGTDAHIDVGAREDRLADQDSHCGGMPGAAVC